MLSSKFLAVAVAAAFLSVGSHVDLSAKCRCGGSRKEARQQHRAERRCAKRGTCSQYVQPVPNGGGGSYYNPYGGDRIDQIGAAPAPSRIGTRGTDAMGRQ